LEHRNSRRNSHFERTYWCCALSHSSREQIVFWELR